MTQRVILIKAVAEMYGVSESTISRWQEEGKIPATISVKGGKRRWLLSDIEQHLASQSTATQMPTTARKQRRNAKAFAERQNATDRALAKYRAKGEQ
jgi:excisionase family DNA binding protein